MDTSWLGDHRDVVVIDGPDAATYLQSQASQDLRGMTIGDERWTFFLQPTGKVDVLARVKMAGDDRFELDTDPGFGTVLEARLNRFKIRVKATVEAIQRARTTATGNLDGDEDGRIAAAWPKMGAEIIPGESIPAETGLDDVAISFTKGCYPGQELVERMNSRGSTAPRHLELLPRRSDDTPGATITHDGAAIGTITSVGTTHVLAYIKRGQDGGARD
jgi:folate-binding protein YgfZ